jgi:hypothetical protein
VLCKKATLGAQRLNWQRCSKNIGGGIAPAAIAGLIEGAVCSVNAFRSARGRKASRENADKLLMKLNFPRRPVMG